MYVAEMRTRLLAAVKRGLNTTYTAAEQDYALQGALHDLDLTGRVNRQQDYFNFSAGNPSVILASIQGLRPDRVTRVEVGYLKRGSWALATAYAVNDLVFNDSRFYVCTVAHTSAADNEPGSSTGSNYWVGRQWDRGDRLNVQTYETIAQFLGDADSPPPYRNEFITDVNGQGKPRMFGFLNTEQAYCYPVPDIAYPGVLIQENPVDEWVAGEGNPDICLPMAALLPVIDVGAAYRLDPRNPKSADWAAEWRESKDRIRSKLVITTGENLKDEAAFSDAFDNWTTTDRFLRGA